MRKSTRSFLVSEAEAGSRLDRYLAGTLGASRGQVRRLLSQGGVAVDDRLVGPGAKGQALTAGSRIEVTRFRPPASQHPLAGSRGTPGGPGRGRRLDRGREAAGNPRSPADRGRAGHPAECPDRPLARGPGGRRSGAPERGRAQARRGDLRGAALRHAGGLLEEAPRGLSPPAGAQALPGDRGRRARRRRRPGAAPGSDPASPGPGPGALRVAHPARG